jgi:hypothetical protein
VILDLTVIIPTSAFSAAFGYMLKLMQEDRKTVKGFNGDKLKLTTGLNNLTNHVDNLENSILNNIENIGSKQDAINVHLIDIKKRLSHLETNCSLRHLGG